MSNSNLRQILTQRLDHAEVRNICFDLGGVDFESLPGEGKSEKVRELILHLEKRGRIPELVSWVKRHRPDIDLGAASSSQSPSNIQSAEHASPTQTRAQSSGGSHQTSTGNTGDTYQIYGDNNQISSNTTPTYVWVLLSIVLVVLLALYFLLF